MAYLVGGSGLQRASQTEQVTMCFVWHDRRALGLSCLNTSARANQTGCVVTTVAVSLLRKVGEGFFV